MSEHPILFKSEMVRAILDGRKTQTRRIIKPQPSKDAQVCTCGNPKHFYTHKEWNPQMACEATHDVLTVKSKYQVGDKLYVRETFLICESQTIPSGVPIYKADVLGTFKETYYKWKPNIHMPKWAARIWFEVTNIRVERVQGISIEDITAEGVTFPKPYLGVGADGCPIESQHIDKDPWYFMQELWDSINKKRGFGWEANPWVWVIEFKRVKK